MNDALRKELDEEAVAVKLANYVLDRQSIDPDGDICLLARQFLRKLESMRSVVHACGGHVFVPSSAIRDANDSSRQLIVSYNAEKHGYDVLLKPVQ